MSSNIYAIQNLEEKKNYWPNFWPLGTIKKTYGHFVSFIDIGELISLLPKNKIMYKIETLFYYTD